LRIRELGGAATFRRGGENNSGGGDFALGFLAEDSLCSNESI
jgi:hypothetical protein